MPSLNTVEQFVALVEQGQFVEAIEGFYAEDASMQENLAAPRVGLANLVAHERRVMARFPTVRVERAGPLWIQGEQVVINWIFEMTDAAGRTSRLDELTRQRWRGDKIVEERFYYDPGQARG